MTEPSTPPPTRRGYAVPLAAALLGLAVGASLVAGAFLIFDSDGSGSSDSISAPDKVGEYSRFVDLEINKKEAAAGDRIAASRGGGRDPRWNATVREFSVRRAICAVAQDKALNNAVDAAREWEISAEIERRTNRSAQGGMFVPMSVIFSTPARDHELRGPAVGLATPAAGPGGLLVADELAMDRYIDRLRSRLICRALGCVVINGLVGNLDVPGLKNSAPWGWVATDGGQVPSGDPSYRLLSLRPKTCGGMVELMRSMLLQVDVPGIEFLIRDDLAKLAAEAIDRGAIAGTGADNQPTGILNAGITKVAIDGPPTWGAMIDLVTAVDSASEGTAFALAPDVRGALMKTPRIAAGDAEMIMPTRDNVAGWPAATSTVVPAGTAIYGGWGDLILAVWNEFRLDAGPYDKAVFAAGGTLVKGESSIDVGVRHVESFAAATGIAVAP